MVSSVPKIEASRIHRLDNRLANQIAAGEVVDRPASVVKELLENSIDAHAKKVEVEIERGGTRLIRVTDDGCGIVKQDLALALSRHATSKIFETIDLAAIQSLGFRGEALASVASVSKLCLTSRTNDSEFAWQATAEGREMAVDIQPASATVGTRVEVRDLFYNTPARQKFLKTEKTEFSHIEEIFKRHALVNFETAFVLKHNHKIIKRVPASNQLDNGLRRIENICGKPFATNAIEFSCAHEVVSMKGWLGTPSFHRSESDIQYVFINGRPVKDKMLNHAIRQSYQGLLPPGRMPAYVIFISIDPARIDVNVHPTKHEVRFDDQRTVHDLLVKSINDAIVNCQSCDSQNSITHDFNSEEQSQTHYSRNENRSDDDFSTDRLPVFPNAGQQRYSAEAVNQAAKYGLLSPVNDLSDDRLTEIVEERENLNYQSANTLPIRPLVKPSGILPQREPKEKVDDSQLAAWRFDSGVWIKISRSGPVLLDEKVLFAEFIELLFSIGETSLLQIQSVVLHTKPLLFPVRTTIGFELLEDFEVVSKIQKLGFIFEPLNENIIVIKQVPNFVMNNDHLSVEQVFITTISALRSKSFEQLYQLVTPLIIETIAEIEVILDNAKINSKATQAITEQQVMQLIS
jgi:DNA mismatch repair protein MutL